MSEPVISPAGFPLLRRLLIALTAAISFIILAGFAAPIVLPPSAVKSISGFVLSRALGYPVHIAGDAKISILPSLVLEATGISATVGGTKDTPVLFDIPLLSFEADALPLLFSRIHVRKLHIEKPELRLALDRFGQANWRSGGFPDATLAGRNRELRPDYDWGQWTELRVQSVEIRDGRVIYQNRQNNRRIIAEKVSLSSSNPVNTTGGPGFLMDGGAVINGETFALKFETGPISKFLSGDRLPIVIDARGAPLRFLFQDGAAKRQFYVGEGNINLHIRDLAPIAVWLGGLFASPVSGQMALTAHINVHGPRLSVENIDLKAGKARGKGAAVFTNETDGRTKIDASFETDTLDLTPFISIDIAKDGETEVAHRISTLLPHASLGTMRVRWNNLRFRQAELGAGDAKVVLAAENRRIDTEITFTNIYRGTGDGHLQIGMAEGMTSLRFDLSVRRFATKPFFAATTGAVPIKGQADISVELLSVGGTFNEIIAALSGTGKFNVRNGEIVADNLVRHLAEDDRTTLAFQQLVGSFNVRSGILSGRDMLMRSQGLSLVGEGEIALTENSVDIELRSLDTSRPKGKGLRPVKPFRVEGSLASFDVIAK
ncbi:MAG: AsmA family protein [Rhodospirillaceae bacterium]|nr:AsmA family protein [Rhodospirillaceae bacterium]